MDGSGSLAPWATASSDGVSVFPGMRYTGRLAYDPLDTLPQGEGVFLAGVGVQTHDEQPLGLLHLTHRRSFRRLHVLARQRVLHARGPG